MYWGFQLNVKVLSMCCIQSHGDKFLFFCGLSSWASSPTRTYFLQLTLSCASSPTFPMLFKSSLVQPDQLFFGLHIAYRQRHCPCFLHSHFPCCAHVQMNHFSKFSLILSVKLLYPQRLPDILIPDLSLTHPFHI